MARFSLKENEYRPEDVFPVLIDPSLVSVLRQTRSSMNYSNLEDLKSSIAKRGQKKPGDIYAFSKLGAVEYLRCINILWNTNYNIQQFENHFIPEAKDDFYLFLIAGHRRLRAAKEVQKLYYAEIHFQKSFEEAIEWQLTENFHEPISLLDLVTAANYLWVMLKGINSKLTLKDFAKTYIHKSVSWLNDALRFSRLPFAVQELIKSTEISKGISYSILLEFVDLYDFSVEKGKALLEDELVILVQHCLAQRYKLIEVRGFIKRQKEKIIGQQEIFKLEFEQVKDNSMSTIRKNRTLLMTSAEQYLNASPAIVKQITNNAKKRAREVIISGTNLGEILTSKE